METLGIINFQLENIRDMFYVHWLEECPYERYYVKKYDEVKFLDVYGFQYFLTTKDIKNNLMLDKIYKNSILILNMYYNSFKELIEEENRLFGHTMVIEDCGIFIYLGKKTWGDTIVGECEEDFNEGGWEHYYISDIINCCEEFAEIYETCYPNFKISYNDINLIESYKSNFLKIVLNSKAKSELVINNNEVKGEEFPEKKLNWFYVGLKFANGELEKYLTENVLSVPKIAKKIGDRKYSKYILCSINNDSTINNFQKNIFCKRHNKANTIIKYCERNNISIVNEFYERMENGSD